MNALFSLTVMVDCDSAKNECCKLKPKPKHPVKVHMGWNIKQRGDTASYFSENFKAPKFLHILIKN